MNHADLYRAHQPWLVGWLRQRLGQWSDRAGDLAQDTFVRLLQSEQAPASLSSPRSYLATVARGLLIDHYRRQDLERAYLAALAALPEPQHPSPEERALALDLLSQIDRLLDGLPARAREAFLLAQLDGWSHAQIAEHQGVSVSSVKKYIHKALLQCLSLL